MKLRQLTVLTGLWMGVAAHAGAEGGAPFFSVKAPGGARISREQLAGRAWLLWYEGPKTAELNDDAKARLTQVMQGLPEAQRPQLVAVGDVSGYDFWPARGFAERQLKTYEEKYRHPIYGDWSGAMREAFGFRKDESNLLFVDASGAVLFRARGKVAPADVARVEALLRGER